MSATPRVAVAMSGGLDSSVVAWLLAREARAANEENTVVGLSMLLWDQMEERKNGRCCGSLDLLDARRVAQQAGIAHYTLRMDEEFRAQVVDPFVRDYLEGRTPSPCVACNTWIKFDLLFDRARAFGAEAVATGHYARILPGPHGPELHAAVDTQKDQSYFLFELTPEQLERTRFPLGEKHKPEVRDIAREAGLVVAGKGESMEICFVAGSVREFVEEQVAARPEAFGEAGERALVGVGARMVTTAGADLGEGEPYYRYTVGQRRGLQVAAGERLYVLSVQPEQNQVVVGREDDLLAPGLLGERLHWIGPEFATAAEVPATIKIRSRHPGVPGVIRPRQGGLVEVEFSTPQRGVAPGQAAVFYQGTRVLGGCWIREPLA